MRKTQLAIIEKAKKKSFQPNVISMLLDEQYDIKTLQQIYNFYNSHNEEIENPNIFFEIYNFFRDVYNVLGFNPNIDYLMFYRLSINDIIWIKKQYDNNIFIADDVMQLSYIHNRLEKIELNEILEIFNTRKNVIKSIPQFDNYKVLWVSLCNLYSKFPSIPLKDKVEIEYKVLTSGIIDLPNQYDYNILSESGPTYFKETMNHMIRGVVPIFDTIKKYYNFRYDTKSYDASNDYNFYFVCYPDTKTIDSIMQVAEICPDLLGSSESSRKLTFDAIKPKPYQVSAKASVTGISIEFTTYYSYSISYRKIISTDKKDYYVKILFTYDYKCFIYNSYLRKWVPITLPQISMLYRFDFWKDIFDSYADIVSKDGTVWKDLKKSFNNGSGMPPLIANDILNFKTKKDMMFSMYKHSDIINWNKKDLYIGYLTMKALPLVRDSDKNILTDYVNKNDLLFKQDDIYANVKELLSKVIIARLEFYNKDYIVDDNIIIKIIDYISMSKYLHRKISLSFNSPNSLLEAHNDVMILHRDKYTEKVKIPKHSKFLKLMKMLPNEFEWIKTIKRLVQEGVQMHHCVASYASKINRDYCAIYSFIYDNQRYTIEFCCHKDTYDIVQIQGKYDSGCSEDVRKYVKSFIVKK